MNTTITPPAQGILHKKIVKSVSDSGKTFTKRSTGNTLYRKWYIEFMDGYVGECVKPEGQYPNEFRVNTSVCFRIGYRNGTNDEIDFVPDNSGLPDASFTPRPLSMNGNPAAIALTAAAHVLQGTGAASADVIEYAEELRQYLAQHQL